MKIIKGGLAEKNGAKFSVNADSLGRRLNVGGNNVGRLRNDREYLNRSMKPSRFTESAYMTYLDDLS